MVKRLTNVSSLNEAFGIDAPAFIETEIDFTEDVKIPPVNDFGGEDCFWTNATPEMMADRAEKISATYLSFSADDWKQLNTHRQQNNPQRQEIILDGQTFISKNAAARYAMEKYSVSRNTAIRYIDENRPFDNKKQSNRGYGGGYNGGVKYGT